MLQWFVGWVTFGMWAIIPANVTVSFCYQVNFFGDHTKVILSPDSHDYLVTYINQQREATTYHLLQVRHFGCHPEIVERLRYGKRVLEKIINVSGESVWQHTRTFTWLTVTRSINADGSGWIYAHLYTLYFVTSPRRQRNISQLR